MKPSALLFLPLGLITLLSPNLSMAHSQSSFQVAQSSTTSLAQGQEHLKDFNYLAVWEMLTADSQEKLATFLSLWSDWREFSVEDLMAILNDDSDNKHNDAWSLLREKLEWPEQFALPHFKAVYENGQKKLEWWTSEQVIRTRGQIHHYTMHYQNEPLDTYPVYPAPNRPLIEGCWAGKPIPIGGEGTYEPFWTVSFFKQVMPNVFLNENTSMHEFPDYDEDFNGYMTGVSTQVQYLRMTGKKDSYGHPEMEIFRSLDELKNNKRWAMTSYLALDKQHLHNFGPWGNAQLKMVRCGPKTIEAVFACRDMAQISRPCNLHLYGPIIQGPKKTVVVHDQQPLVGPHESPGSNYRP